MRWPLIGLVLVGCAGETRMPPDDGRLSVCEYSEELFVFSDPAEWTCDEMLDCACGPVCVVWLSDSGAAIGTSCGCSDRPAPLAEQPVPGVAPEDCNP